VLRAHHPRLICEVGQSSAAEVRDLLVKSGYILYDGDQPAGQRPPVREAPFNTLALSTS